MKERGGVRLSGTQANHLTKECIKQALLLLMEEQKYEDITITEIIKRSGVSRASFYRTYPSKEVILEEIRNEVKNQVWEHFYSKEETIDVKQLLVKVFSFLKKNTKAVEVLRKMSELDNVILIPQITDYYVVEGTENLYQLNMCEGAINALITSWMERGRKEEPEYMAELAFRMCGENYQELLKKPIG